MWGVGEGQSQRPGQWPLSTRCNGQPELGRGSKWFKTATLRPSSFLSGLFPLFQVLSFLFYFHSGNIAEALYRRETFSSVSAFGWSILFLTFIRYHIKKIWQGHWGGGYILLLFKICLGFWNKMYLLNKQLHNNKGNKKRIILSPILFCDQSHFHFKY